MAAVATGTMLLLRDDQGRGGQPAPLTVAVATYQEPGDDWSTAGPAPPLPDIGDLTWRGATSRDLGGHPATVHLYADNAGHRLLVARSPQPFPDAAHLDRVDGGPSWIATIDGAVMFCADRPGSSWLAIGATRDQVLAAGHVLGLR